MTEHEDPRAQYRQLPEPVLPEDGGETVDTTQVPERDLRLEEERFLRHAG